MITSTRPREWAYALALCSGVAWFMLEYHAWWRGKPFGLQTLHECLALAGLAGLSCALACGPLGRMLQRPGLGAHLRRPLALVGAGLAGAHITVILVGLRRTYDWAWYRGHAFTLAAAVAATLLFAALAVTSFRGPARRLGARRWHTLHSLGWLALLVLVIHVLGPGRLAKWAEWLTRRDHPAPPGTLPWTLLAMAVLVLRFGAWAGRRAAVALAAAVPAAAALAVVFGSPLSFGKLDSSVMVFCGGSMRAPVEELAGAARPMPRLDFGGSESLLPRVLAGAPADILVTHDPFCARLRERGLVRREIEVGELAPVIVVPRGNPRRLRSLPDLAQPGLRLGLPDARYSTCGEYVRDELARTGLTDTVTRNVVVERRTHQELATDLRLGVIDAAIVWNFVAAQDGATIDPVPLQGAWPRTRVLLCGLKGGRHPELADRLLDSWGSDEGRAVFARLGYATR